MLLATIFAIVITGLVLRRSRTAATVEAEAPTAAPLTVR
jgi:hypothetical protein